MEVRRPDPTNDSFDAGEGDLEPGSVLDAVPTSAADVESAGRSCLAILILMLAIVVLTAIWFIFWTSG